MIYGTVISRVAAYRRNLDARISRNLDSIGVFLQAEIVRSFGSPSAPDKDTGPTTPTGRKTTAKRFRKGQHSLPGDTPFVQTGTLRRSITFQRDGTKTVLVGSSLQPQGGNPSYAWMLEMGSPGGQLAARPYLRPAVRKNKRKILKMFTER
jgi:hypothetical protein